MSHLPPQKYHIFNVISFFSSFIEQQYGCRSMSISKKQHFTDRPNASSFTIDNAQIPPISPDSDTTPPKSLNPSILYCQMGFHRQFIQSAQFFISLQLSVKQNHYQIAIEKLKNDKTNPI
jgi:hypothetical protein